MATVRHLARAPLREALIDIQLERPLGSAFADGLKNRSLPGFEIKNEIRQFSIQLVGTGPSPENRVEELLGWRYESPDGSRVVQLRHNGMTYSMLREYTEWNDIKSATRDCWNLYSRWANQPSVARIAVRYINVLEIPATADLNTYLTSAPQVPPSLPQALSHFLERIVVPFDRSIFAIITQTLEPTISTKPISRVILDIDVYSECDFASGSDDLWRFFDRLRDVKNSIFFSSITEKTLEAYE